MNTLEKDFINYNQALEMNALGFNEPCFGRYDGKGNNKGKLWYEMPNSGQDTIPVGDVLAPTFSQAFRFFREKYDFYVTIHSSLNPDFFPVIRTSKAQYHIGNFNSYEEAESACLDKLIELAKTK